jgi:hypothetical protein
MHWPDIRFKYGAPLDMSLNGAHDRGDSDYHTIERRRQERMRELAQRLISRREQINRSIEEELNRYDEEGIVEASNIPMEYDEHVAPSKATEPVSVKTNIPFTSELISAFILNDGYVEIERELQEEKKVLDRQTQLKIKLQVNKRLTQVSGRTGQVVQIAEILREYSTSLVFVETFTLKIIDQGRMQVSTFHESYRQYAELFCRLYSPRLMHYFRAVLFTKEATVETVKGIYSIYFGILEAAGDADEAWFFIASILNASPSPLTCYVVEAFLLILSDLLHSRCRGPFTKLLVYIREHFLTAIDNDPCRSRISSIISRYR